MKCPQRSSHQEYLIWGASIGRRGPQCWFPARGRWTPRQPRPGRASGSAAARRPPARRPWHTPHKTVLQEFPFGTSETLNPEITFHKQNCHRHVHGPRNCKQDPKLCFIFSPGRLCTSQQHRQHSSALSQHLPGKVLLQNIIFGVLPTNLPELPAGPPRAQSASASGTAVAVAGAAARPAEAAIMSRARCAMYCTTLSAPTCDACTHLLQYWQNVLAVPGVVDFHLHLLSFI